MRFIRFAALLPAIALAAACAQNSKAPPTSPAPAARSAATDLDPSATVGSVNGQPVTAGELDALVGDEVKSARTEYLNKVYEARNAALEQLLVDRMMDAEAKARGTTKEELFQQEVMSKVTPPTEEELQSTYDRFIRGRYDVSFEDAKDRLAMQLMQEKQQVRADAFFQELKAKYKSENLLPPPRAEVAATGPSKGPKNAPITIVEFSDFECPFCSRVLPTLDQVTETYGDKVRIVFRHYPLPFHPNAPKAAEASLCAEDQGKFWEMHDLMFQNQKALDVPQLKQAARTVGMDGAKFDACLDSGEKAETVRRDMAEGQAAGVSGTPAFFINGRLLSGAQPFEEFKRIIDAELAMAGKK